MAVDRRNPPLAELRVFEAAARHLSFTRAAMELGVTQGAVSQRVKILETMLERRLFQRLTRALALTEDGIRLAESVSEALARIDDGLVGLEQKTVEQQQPSLTISVAPDFASKWLMPRLPDFHDRYPNISLKIDADRRLADCVTDGVDLAIRFGPGQYPGLETRRLMADAVVPVCQPSLLSADKPLEDPTKIFDHVLLHDASTEAAGGGWNEWLRRAGISIQRHRSIHFSDAHLAIEAAGRGLGIALGRTSLINDDVAAGRLARPFSTQLATRYSYYIVHRPHVNHNADLKSFVEWLFEEAELWRLRDAFLN